MKDSKIFIILLIIFLIIFSACSDSSTEPEENIVLPDSSLNFNDHIYPLFTAKCSSRSGCHTISSPAAGLNVNDYNAVITHFLNNAPSEPLIRVGEGENSPLYKILILDDFQGISRMPKDGPYLNSNQYEGVKTWIDEGAKASAN